MALDEELRSIRTRIATKQREKARAQVELENAQKELTKAKAALKEEFGVVTNDEAKALLIKLNTELKEAVTSVEEELEAAGA